MHCCDTLARIPKWRESGGLEPCRWHLDPSPVQSRDNAVHQLAPNLPVPATNLKNRRAFSDARDEKLYRLSSRHIDRSIYTEVQHSRSGCGKKAFYPGQPKGHRHSLFRGNLFDLIGNILPPERHDKTGSDPVNFMRAWLAAR